MTGFGDARVQDQRLTVVVEVRTVNNRYLKINVKCPDVYAALEGDIERVVREKVSRGTVSVTLRTERASRNQDYTVNEPALESYWRQIQALAHRIQAPLPADVASLLALPGVVSEETRAAPDLEQDWEIFRPAIIQALEKLYVFRCEEGRQMQAELEANGQTIAAQLAQVVALAPQVVSEYRQKLMDRVRQALAEGEAQVSAHDLIREVSIYADRSDINEEITRLRCHLDQFQAFMGEAVSAGRKLEFLSQEMFREINTIGSKANNVTIAHAVVEMKAAVEKVREILQNVE